MTRRDQELINYNVNRTTTGDDESSSSRESLNREQGTMMKVEQQLIIMSVFPGGEGFLFKRQARCPLVIRYIWKMYLSTWACLDMETPIFGIVDQESLLLLRSLILYRELWRSSIQKGVNQTWESFPLSQFERWTFLLWDEGGGKDDNNCSFESITRMGRTCPSWLQWNDCLEARGDISLIWVDIF